MKIILALLLVAASVTAWLLIAKSDDLKASKNKVLRTVGKAVEYFVYAIGACVGVPVALACVAVTGFLVLLLPMCFVSLFSKDLANSLDHVVFSDRAFPLRLVIPMLVGCVTLLCGLRISRAWERRRAVEDEIKPVLDIQIREPPSPSRVEKFFGKDGPPDRLFNRCFGWIENIANDRVRFVVGFVVWTVVALPVGGVTMWLRRTQFGPLSPWEAIPVAFLYGSVLIFLLLLAFAGLGWAARNVRAMRTWMEGKLPRRVILPYRSWQLRRMARNRWPCDPLGWLLTLVAIALMTLAAVSAWQLLTHTRGGEDDSEEVTDH